jgi:hypothetical protein
MEEYLRASEVIDWQHPEIVELAKRIASGHKTSTAIAKSCHRRSAASTGDMG